MIDPKVTVIVATYNWSAALRCALRAIGDQTFADFEVLVVGDACTDDTADVVESFGDVRFSYVNMARNHGSQWAPNNLALHRAKGEFVAYCGHDDIWHPEHLSCLLATIAVRNADAVVSGLLMYGPPGTGQMYQAGLLATATMQPTDFVPPSAFMHRRNLVFDVGWWSDPDTTALPVDFEFQRRVMRRGPIYTSGTVTVFKFNAASRRDAYKTKSVVEQEAMLSALAGSGDARQAQLLKALQCFAEGKLQAITAPLSDGLAPGEIARRNARYKGTEAQFTAADLRRLDTSIRFGLDSMEAFHEWHGIEHWPGIGNFRWSGPLDTSIIDLPLLVDRPATIAIRVLAAADESLIASLLVAVNGSDRSHRTRQQVGGSFQDIEVDIEPLDEHLRIALKVGKTLRAGPDDSRRVGLAVAWVEVTPNDAVVQEMPSPSTN